MTLQPTFDGELKEGKNYKLRSVYRKNGLLHIKFETKFGLHRGTYKENLLYINPETGREKYFDEIEKTVNKLFSTDTNKQYVAEATENIDKVFAVEEREVPITNSTQNNAKTLAIEIADMEITEENKTERAEKLKNVQNSKET